MMRRLAITAILAASPALAQVQAESTVNPGGVPAADLARLATIQTGITTMINQTNEKMRGMERLLRCGTQGLAYSPNHPNADLVTGCVRIGLPQLVRDFRVTSAGTDGNLTALGTTPADRLQAFINANGCPTAAGWRTCTEQEVLYAFNFNIGEIHATNYTFAWLFAADTSMFETINPPPSIIGSRTCAAWGNNGGTIYAPSLQSYNDTSGSLGFTLRTCNNVQPVACCR